MQTQKPTPTITVLGTFETGGQSLADMILKLVDNNDLLVARTSGDTYVMGAFLESDRGLDSPWLRVTGKLTTWLGMKKVVYHYSLHSTASAPATVTTPSREVIVNELKHLRVCSQSLALMYLSSFESLMLDTLEES